MTVLQFTECHLATCRKCSAAYEASAAQARKLDFICKPCRAEKDRLYREQRKTAGFSVSGCAMPREYHQRYQEEYRERPEVRARKRDEAQRRYRDPIERAKSDVRRLTRNAIGRGELQKAPCEVCGSAKVDAHHDDYSQPLNVRWLCRLHHNEHHAKARGDAK